MWSYLSVISGGIYKKVVLLYGITMEMTAEEMRQIMARLKVGQRQLARILGVHERTVRHYVGGDREVPTSLAILLKLMDQRPELFQVVETIAGTGGR